jgi:hypothetical protein
MSIQQTQDGLRVPTTHFRKLNIFALLCCSTLFVFASTVQGAAATAPPTISFTVSPTSVAAGGTVHLAYTLKGATSATLSNGAQSGSYPATSDSGSTTVSKTTTFTLTAKGPGGTDHKSITVTVKAAKTSPSPSGTAPVISSFTASTATVAAGGSSVLRWTVTGTSPKVTVNGAAATSPMTVKPTATTSYKLVATNSGGSVSDSVVVKVTAATPTNTSGTALTDCQPITKAGSYSLANDVSSSGTCFPIGASNVSLNLNGHTITYGTGGGSAPTPAISACAPWFSGLTASQCVEGSDSNLTVYGGNIVQSSNAAPFSPVFWIGQGGSGGGSIHNLNATFHSVGSQFFHGEIDGGGFSIQNNVINDNVTNIQHPGQSPLGARAAFQGYVIYSDEEGTGSPAPDTISGNTINGSPQGGIADGVAGSQIYNNTIKLTSTYSNDYGVLVDMNSQNVHGNTITGQGRGLDGESSGFIFSGNTVNVAEGTGNTEYGGCELDGTYGIRVKNYDWPNSTESGTAPSTNFQITNNTVTVPATHCPSTALDLTDMNSLVSGTISGNSFSAPAGSGGLANALGFESIDAAKITFQANHFTAPTCVLIGGNGDIPYGQYTVQAGQTWSCAAGPTVVAQDDTYGQSNGTPPLITIKDSISNPTVTCVADSTAVVSIGSGYTHTCDLKGQ